MEPGEAVRQVVDLWAVDLWGVADLEPAAEFIVEQGGEAVAGFPRAVVMGIALPHAVVDQLPKRDDWAVKVAYRHQYDTINRRLDLIASHVTSLLQQQGFQALPVPASERIDSERICGVFSHKLAAHLAGLGWIGKSCLLVTPQVGPRLRWVTVLTDAPLQSTGSPMVERCGSCRECVEACPVGAFTGEPFKESDPREVRYDAGACDKYFREMSAEKRGSDVCGLCVYVCPHGRARA
ncbi:MAG: epoxyqueuosine reductase [Thermoleophilia bacterium]|nr:epoxyqueuosine reductase [Thermoleophilia bacterium]